MWKIDIIQHDITQLEVGAVVNAANNSLLGGGGVDGAIHRAAGPELLRECQLLNGCETGQAKLTKGYRLPAQYIIHTVGPVWRGGGEGEAELLASCYRQCLQIAQQQQLTSIAFPAISCGVYQYPVELAANIALTSIMQYLRQESSLNKVLLVCFDETILNAYHQQYQLLGESDE